MIIVALSNKDNFESKLSSILDTAKQRHETGVVIMTDRNWHMEVFKKMQEHKGIGSIKVAGSHFFVIKGMRIELKPIDFYI